MFNIILILGIIITSGCESKKVKTSVDSSNVFSSKDKNLTQKNKTSFNIKDTKNTYSISLIDDKLKVKGYNKSIVMLNIFDAKCKSCLNQIKSLKKLEKKYKEKLLLLTLFTNKDEEENNTFIQAVHERLSISNTILPLSIIFKDTTYYSHFENITPIEMIRHDIQNAIQ